VLPNGEWGADPNEEEEEEEEEEKRRVYFLSRSKKSRLPSSALPLLRALIASLSPFAPHPLPESGETTFFGSFSHPTQVADLSSVDVSHARYHVLAHQQQPDALFGVPGAQHIGEDDLWVGVGPKGVGAERGALGPPQCLVGGVQQRHARDVQCQGVGRPAPRRPGLLVSSSLRRRRLLRLDQAQARGGGPVGLRAERRDPRAAAHAKVDGDDLPLPLFSCAPALEKVEEPVVVRPSGGEKKTRKNEVSLRSPSEPLQKETKNPKRREKRTASRRSARRGAFFG
jgi:hypothetical protein